jgi:hypothetical protein
MDEEDVRESKMVTSIMRVIAIEKEFVTRNLTTVLTIRSLLPNSSWYLFKMYDWDEEDEGEEDEDEDEELAILLLFSEDSVVF